MIMAWKSNGKISYITLICILNYLRVNRHDVYNLPLNIPAKTTTKKDQKRLSQHNIHCKPRINSNVKKNKKATRGLEENRKTWKTWVKFCFNNQGIGKAL